MEHLDVEVHAVLAEVAVVVVLGAYGHVKDVRRNVLVFTKRRYHFATKNIHLPLVGFPVHRVNLTGWRKFRPKPAWIVACECFSALVNHEDVGTQVMRIRRGICRYATPCGQTMGRDAQRYALHTPCPQPDHTSPPQPRDRTPPRPTTIEYKYTTET